MVTMAAIDGIAVFQISLGSYMDIECLKNFTHYVKAHKQSFQHQISRS